MTMGGPDDIDTDMQFRRPFVSAPQRLIPRSAEAVRLHSRALLAGLGPTPFPSPKEHQALQEAYVRRRAAWLAAIGWKPNDDGQG
jgi:hypothetical protein